MKKIIGLVLTIAMLLTSSSAVFAGTGPKVQTQEQKVEFKKQLDAVAKKHGGKVVILNNVDPSTVKLHFDTIEEFDQALSSIKITTTSGPKVKSTGPLSANATKYPYYDDHTLWVAGLAAASVRNRVYAEIYWDSDFRCNRFSQVVSQSSYTTGSNLGVTWNQLDVDNNIIDSGDTLTSRIEGTATLTSSVGSQDVGYSWDKDFYDEFYAQ